MTKKYIIENVSHVEGWFNWEKDNFFMILRQNEGEKEGGKAGYW